MVEIDEGEVRENALTGRVSQDENTIRIALNATEFGQCRRSTPQQLDLFHNFLNRRTRGCGGDGGILCPYVGSIALGEGTARGISVALLLTNVGRDARDKGAPEHRIQ